MLKDEQKIIWWGKDKYYSTDEFFFQDQKSDSSIYSDV